MKSPALYVLLAVAATVSLLARFYDPFPGDVSLILWVQTWGHPVTTDFMEAASRVGGTWAMASMGGVAALSLFALRRQREALTVVGAVAMMGLIPLLKLLIDRPRPPADLVSIPYSPDGLGFPSGHAFQSLVLLGVLAYLSSIFISRTWLRRFVQTFLALLILAIGISRVYLGAHWPSDVLGGYLLGGFFLALLLQLYRGTAPTPAP